jgi:hypothetical protein
MLRTKLASLADRGPLPAPSIIVVGNSVAPESELQLHHAMTITQSTAFENTNIVNTNSRGDL